MMCLTNQLYYARQSGFALLPVAIIIAVVASIAYLIAHQSAMNVNNVGSHNDSTRAEYIAQAGLQHALWQANNSGCVNYGLASTNFGDDNYSATISPIDSSPVTINATGTLANGTSRTITRDNISIYNLLSQTVILQPGSEGIDSFLEGESGHLDHNKKGDMNLETNSDTTSTDRSLIQFDLSSLPTSIKIDSAILELYLHDNVGPEDTVEAHALTRSWTEDGVTWETYDGVTSWTSPGGDYENQSVAEFVTSGVGWHSLDITSLTQKWTDGEFPNNGVILLSEASSGAKRKKYHSSDEKEATLRPKLTITYLCECGLGPCEMPPSSDPIVYLKLDETSGITAFDFTTNHDGTLMNGSEWNSSGQEDGALKFDEVNDYIELDDFDFRTSITISFGIKIDDNSGSLFQYMYSHGDINNTNSLNIFLNEASHGTDPNKLRTVLRDTNDSLDNTSLEFDVSSIIGDGFWHTYTLTVESGVGSKVYLDGVLMNSDTRGGDDFDPTTNLYLGSRQDLNSGRYYGGLLDNVRIYEFALSAEEVADIAPPPGFLPIAHWKLDETGGIIATDSSGGHDGTLENGPVWTTDGKIDGMLYFDGVNDQVTVPHNDALSFTNGLTMSAWVQNTSSSISGTYRIISKETNGSNDSYWLALSGGVLYMGIGGQFFSAPTSFVPDQWYHIVGTYDKEAAEVNIYVNGIRILNQSIFATLNSNNAAVIIGSNWEGYKWWEGYLDDIRLFDRALTEENISALASRDDVTDGEDSKPPVDSCSETYIDEFNTISFSNSNGTQDWGSNWLEVNESNGPTSGDISIVSDLGHSYVLRIRDNDGGGEGVAREVDLSAYKFAMLNFSYSRNSLDGKSDYVLFDGSADGGITWTEIGRIEGPGTDDSYFSVSKDISAFISNNTRIRFISSSTLGGKDEVYFDNIEIEVSGCRAK
ncbi:MAG: LamG-like jellyroll fold domain-containing protein [Gammaproteobacteria bacterium]